MIYWLTYARLRNLMIHRSEESEAEFTLRRSHCYLKIWDINPDERDHYGIYVASLD